MPHCKTPRERGKLERNIMAHSFVKPSFIPSILLALFLFLAVSSCSARTVEVFDICTKHPNPSNCFYILNAIPGVAEGADLDSLSRYVINFAHTHALVCVTLIDDLIKNTTDQQLKQHYTSCYSDYGNVTLCLELANDSFNSGDYNGIRSNGNTVVKEVQDCNSRPPYDPSALPSNNKYLEDVSLIITILADFLSGKY